MSGRQYVAVKFRPGDRKSWTYHWDGEPLACGDVVKVPDRSGDGWQRATVYSFSSAFPQMVTKPILGRVDDRPEPHEAMGLDLFGKAGE